MSPSSVFLHRAAELLAAGEPTSGLPLGAAAYVLSLLPPGPRWVVLPTEDQAERFHELARFYQPPPEDPGATPPILRYPADDLPPYSGVSPHPLLARRRLLALVALLEEQPVSVVTSPRALLPRVVVPEVLLEAVEELEVGRSYPRRRLRQHLSRLGYLSSGTVEDPGTFAVRGEVLDLWPPQLDRPVRTEWFDEDLESMRRFDPETGRTDALLHHLRILPTREWIPGPDTRERFLRETRPAAGRSSEAASLRRRLAETLESRLSVAGIEDWLPALHPLCSPLDHAPEAPRVVFEPGRAMEVAHNAYRDARRRHAEMDPDEQPLVPPEDRFSAPEDLDAALRPRAEVLPLAVDGTHELGLLANDDLEVGKGELAPLADRLKAWLHEDWRVMLCARSSSTAEQLQALLDPYDLPARPTAHRDPRELEPGRLHLHVGVLHRGFRAPADRIAVITGDEIFARRHTPARRVAHRAFRQAREVAFGSLEQGALVVHRFHGIGQYDGMDRLEMGGVETDFVRLSYRDGDRLYVPVHHLDLLTRYQPASEGRKPRLDRLGGQSWERRKRKVQDAMVATAHELLEIQARREVVERPPLPAPGSLYRRFCATFPFTETPDQEAAIREVDADLAAPRPMDRVVVGDVGFGKTEVAMRAAARLVEIGRQVAVLCPTTVLAYQHHQTWTERFSGFDVRIAMLSRLTDAAEARRVRAAVRNGEVDVLVGTTRLLNRNLRYHDLGLVVVDEEHRFGVRQKEHLKRFRAELDVLSLSATPIPRTLHLALSGVRDFSTIATPPADRLAIHTRISRFDEQTVRGEIIREMSRGGQVYYVHNRIRSLEAVAERLRRLVPEARFVVTHGQMPAETLESALVRFVRKQADVLVTTSIIESGVDLPNVNCVIVDRAHHFGLAQLYQIRGRVGRSFQRARCLLLVPPPDRLTRKAIRRLRVLQDHTELGAGFAVASADLEQRGPGEILGGDQHGHLDAVGMDTWVELLEEAMAEARGQMWRKRLDPEVEVPVPTLLPESWIPGVEDRLTEYRTLSLCETPEQVRRAVDDLERRHGEAPAEALNLGWLHQIRLRCRTLGIERLTWLGVRVEARFVERSPVPTAHLEDLARTWPNRVDLPDPGRILVRFTPQEAEHPFRFLHWLLRRFEDRPEVGLEQGS